MDSALVACFDRVRHAKVHVRSLKRAFRAYTRDGYRVEPELDLGASGQPAWSIYATRLKETPAQLGLLVVDAVNDLRGALDNLVWALSVKHSGPPPPFEQIKKSPWANYHFPVILAQRDWNSVPGNQLRGVDPSLVADFEALQPYRRRPADPARAELAILNEMWTRDKHRRPGIVLTPAAFVGFTDHDVPIDSLADYGLEVVKVAPLGPLEHRAEVVRVRKIPKPGSRMVSFEMGVDFQFAFDIRFEQGPPGYGAPVPSTLKACVDQVEVTLRKFEHVFL